MTNRPEADAPNQTAAKSLALPFASSEIETAGIRVTRAEFSRLMGCSKQAVTDWVKAGRVIVGADGRLDPRQAVRSLLATGDPAKIRARVLAPLVAEMDKLRQRIAALESALAREKENAEFHEAAASELNAIIEATHYRLALGWSDLQTKPQDAALLALELWIEAAREHGGDPGSNIADYTPTDLAGTQRKPKFSALDLMKF